MDGAALNVDSDVTIIGGGPVGATLALALSRAADLRVTLLEAQSDFTRSDSRTLALSHGSRMILERIGIWNQLTSPTPITGIHISQRGSFGRALLTAEEAGLPALGYVIRYAELQQALHAALQNSGVRYLTGAQVDGVASGGSVATVQYAQEGAAQMLHARLAVLADGGRTLKEIPGVVREQRDYGQVAVVAHVRTELPHNNLAYERFTADGPAALLPAGDGYALVWTASPERAQEILAWDEATFLTALHAHFGDRQGRFTQTGARASFPLTLKYSSPVTQPHLVLIGNAAQTLHPVAGQGFNMGLRDAWELATEIQRVEPTAIGSADMLARYRAGRRVDVRGGILFTDALVRGFSNTVPGLRAGRAAALTALDVLPKLKSFVVRRMSFGAKG